MEGASRSYPGSFCGYLASSWCVFRRLGVSLGHSWRRFGRLGTSWGRLGALLARLGRVLVPSWPPLGAQGRVRPGLAWNGKSEKGSKTLKTNPRKNIKETWKSSEIECKMLQKSMQNHAFGCLGVPLGRLGTLRLGVGAPRPDFVLSWGGLPTSWGSLEAFLGRPWDILVASGGLLERSWGRLGSSWTSLGRLGITFAPCFGHLAEPKNH